MGFGGRLVARNAHCRPGKSASGVCCEFRGQEWKVYSKDAFWLHTDELPR
jgi:hypothetical protein